MPEYFKNCAIFIKFYNNYKYSVNVFTIIFNWIPQKKKIITKITEPEIWVNDSVFSITKKMHQVNKICYQKGKKCLIEARFLVDKLFVGTQKKTQHSKTKTKNIHCSESKQVGTFKMQYIM